MWQTVPRERFGCSVGSRLWLGRGEGEEQLVVVSKRLNKTQLILIILFPVCPSGQGSHPLPTHRLIPTMPVSPHASDPRMHTHSIPAGLRLPRRYPARWLNPTVRVHSLLGGGARRQSPHCHRRP